MALLLSHLLTESARTWPEQTALVSAEANLSYAELDSLSSRLAGQLRSAGLARGDRVAIYRDKSPEALVSIFALLKADAVYIPLDPGAPVARLSYITNNCGARAIVSSAAKAQRLQEIIAAADSLRLLVLIGEGEIQRPPDLRLILWSQLMALSNVQIHQRNTEADLATSCIRQALLASRRG